MSTFFEHFKNLSYKNNQKDNFDPRDAASEGTINEDLNSEFSYSDITACIKKLKNNKSSGIDNIINEYLKNCPDSVILLIVKLFNLILKTGIIPTDWCKGLIQPIFKNKGSINSVDNYRGIYTFMLSWKIIYICIKL